MFITIPGYGPYWAGWSSENHAEPIPARFTAELEAAWTVGGIIVDRRGKAGRRRARSVPASNSRNVPASTRQIGIGTRLTTDAAGKWHFDSVPVSMSEVHVEIDHPSFMPIRRSLARREFGIEPRPAADRARSCWIVA